MKYVIFILSLVIISGRISAQVVVHNDLANNEARPASHAPSVSESLEPQSYTVTFIRDRKASTFEVISPKSDKGEVKLVNAAGSDICTIHKGRISEGKNFFRLRNRVIPRGIYYVVSKLASGEQFADRIVVDK